MADTQDGAVAVTLGGLSVSGSGHSGWAQKGSGATQVPAPVFSFNGRAPYTGQVGKVQRLSGPPTTQGGAIYQFNGKPNKSVVWSLLSGAGTIDGLSETTDDWGRAWAVYSPGGYEGAVEIEVLYGS